MPRRVPLLARGLVYACAFVAIESVWGLAARVVLGDFVCRYAGPLVVTSFAALPTWYVGGMVAEWLVRQVCARPPGGAP